MHKIYLFTLILISLLSISCSNDSTANNSGSDVTSTTDYQVEVAQQTIQPAEINSPVPDEKTILADIYKKPIQEGSDNQLSDGRYVDYWSGQQFTHDGKNYFVAFSAATPESEIEYPTFEDKVTISQATYEFFDDNWKLKKVQDEVGKFGSNNRAPFVNSEKKAVSFENPAGILVIAVPTEITAMLGLQISFYDILAFSPVNSQWTYLGNVKAGSDNTAGCAHEHDSVIDIKCAKSSGILQFSMPENSAWPELNVMLQGTELGEGGNVLTLTDKNFVTYRYDEKSSSYQVIH